MTLDAGSKHVVGEMCALSNVKGMGTKEYLYQRRGILTGRRLLLLGQEKVENSRSNRYVVVENVDEKSKYQGGGLCINGACLFN